MEGCWERPHPHGAVGQQHATPGWMVLPSQHLLQGTPSQPSPPPHKLLCHGVGVQAPPASAQGRVPDLQIGRTAVDVVFCKGRKPSDVVGVKDVGLLPGLAGQPLLREGLVFHQVRIVGVLPSFRGWQRVLPREKQSLNSFQGQLLLKETSR